MHSIVAYLRVSTQKQGASGLGLEAQRQAISRFAEAEHYQIADTFTEVETGKGADALERRPQLAAAIKAVRGQVPRRGLQGRPAQPRRAFHFGVYR